MPFLALDLAVDLNRLLREPLAQLRRHDANLARHADEAAVSVALNIGEGSGRNRAARVNFYRIALGSLREVDTALRVAVAKGIFAEPPAAAERDRLAGLIFGLTRR
jgi:four helix bundle protein